jgi:hypothetical protein
MVPGSNLGQEICFLDWGISWFSLVSVSKCRSSSPHGNMSCPPLYNFLPTLHPRLSCPLTWHYIIYSVETASLNDPEINRHQDGTSRLSDEHSFFGMYGVRMPVCRQNVQRGFVAFLSLSMHVRGSTLKQTTNASFHFHSNSSLAFYCWTLYDLFS